MKSADKKQESEYARYIRERYDRGSEMTRADEGALEFLLEIPEPYGMAPQMLEYAKAHPDVSVRELVEYFLEIAPREALGLDDENWDDDEEDEDWDDDDYDGGPDESWDKELFKRGDRRR